MNITYMFIPDALFYNNDKTKKAIKSAHGVCASADSPLCYECSYLRTKSPVYIKLLI